VPVPMSEILDSKGLIRNNKVLVIYFPSTNSILPFRILFRYNEGYEEFNYGPLPVSYSGYEPGVIPAGKMTDSITFPYSELPPDLAPDMFYYTESDRLIHAHLKFDPIMLRILVEVPQNQKTYSYEGRVTQDLTKDFGWFRGHKEMIFMPKIHIGWRFYNPTNLDLRTNLHITYAEYNVELIRDADIIYELITRKYPAYWFTFGGKYRFLDLDTSVKVFGLNTADDTIPVFPEWVPKQQVINLIKEKIASWRR